MEIKGIKLTVAILKAEGPTSIFKKEAIRKNGQLTKRAIEILKEVAK